jgi:hypothetical protein
VKIAEVYAVLGDTVAVFRWLDRAVKGQTAGAAKHRGQSDLSGVHNDPRWAAIVPKKYCGEGGRERERGITGSQRAGAPRSVSPNTMRLPSSSPPSSFKE